MVKDDQTFFEEVLANALSTLSEKRGDDSPEHASQFHSKTIRFM
ncbi:Hypothetical protein ACI5QL_01460 [Bacillus velezensis]